MKIKKLLDVKFYFTHLGLKNKKYLYKIKLNLNYITEVNKIPYMLMNI